MTGGGARRPLRMHMGTKQLPASGIFHCISGIISLSDSAYIL